jgi:hypothetical protein
MQLIIGSSLDFQSITINSCGFQVIIEIAL